MEYADEWSTVELRAGAEMGGKEGRERYRNL